MRKEREVSKATSIIPTSKGYVFCGGKIDWYSANSGVAAGFIVKVDTIGSIVSYEEIIYGTEFTSATCIQKSSEGRYFMLLYGLSSIGLGDWSEKVVLASIDSLLLDTICIHTEVAGAGYVGNMYSELAGWYDLYLQDSLNWISICSRMLR